MSPRRRRFVALGLALPVLGVVALVVTTRGALRPLPDELWPREAPRPSLLDRAGRTISRTYDNPWNAHDTVRLHEVPPLLREAFIEAEDQRFFEHGGVDWLARLHATVQNVRSLRPVRGASTISEQVVRMVHRRRRSLWARWVEGFEAMRLERRFDKGEILEFYLNQVPYARRRRGVAQAARDYFDRDLDTLSVKESLALAVLVRSPGSLDPRRGDPRAGERLEAGIGRLARRLKKKGRISNGALQRIEATSLELAEPSVDVRAPHFALHVRGLLESRRNPPARVLTTLDGSLQQRIEAILEHQVEVLAPRGVGDGAVLVADHRRNEILAWVNAGGFSSTRPGSQVDAILMPRQPGSTLKPFVYALALEDGWSAATRIDDTPFAAPVGAGLHPYRNYSRRYHGPLRLRVALGSSLNVPAVRTIQAVTPERFLGKLRELGFDSLDRSPSFYGEGLVLGNGEVTLLELVGAYATLARGGVWAPLGVLGDDAHDIRGSRRIFSEEVSSILADILSDPEARVLEFGRGGVLDLPVQTAVKTGTSNDYRDAWTVGFSDRYTVGVWMGNVDRREMDGVSGAIGPALVLRAVFAELRRDGEPRPLPLSRKLQRRRICRLSGASAGTACPAVDEWFRAGRDPRAVCPLHGVERNSAESAVNAPAAAPRLVQPTPGLHLATDPRIPDDLEAFGLAIEVARPPSRVEWYVDGRLVGSSRERRFAWPVTPGDHVAQARIWYEAAEGPVETARVSFFVK